MQIQLPILTDILAQCIPLKARGQVSVRIERIVKEDIDFIDQTENTFISMNASSCWANIEVRWYFRMARKQYRYQRQKIV